MSVNNNSNVRFIYSFPHHKTDYRGGWKQLSHAVWELRQQQQQAATRESKQHKRAPPMADHDGDDIFYDTDDDDDHQEQQQLRKDDESTTKLLNRLHLYAMSGSFGDLLPDFINQMRLAFAGSGHRIVENEKDKEQDEVVGGYIFGQ